MSLTSNIQNIKFTYCKKSNHDNNICNLICLNDACDEKIICGMCVVEHHRGHKLDTFANFVDNAQNAINNKTNALREKLAMLALETKEIEDKIFQNENELANVNTSAQSVVEYCKKINPILFDNQVIISESNIDINRVDLGPVRSVGEHTESKVLNAKSLNHNYLLCIVINNAGRAKFCLVRLSKLNKFETKFDANDTPLVLCNGIDFFKIDKCDETTSKCIQMLERTGLRYKIRADGKLLVECIRNRDYGDREGILCYYANYV